MKIEIEVKDGQFIYPSFSPEHYESVLKFYKKLYKDGAIVGWAIYNL